MTDHYLVDEQGNPVFCASEGCRQRAVRKVHLDGELKPVCYTEKEGRRAVAQYAAAFERFMAESRGDTGPR